jgi:LacI family transcriptional regulator
MTHRTAGERVVLGDVAQRAGVSVSTASRALAEDRRISAATRRAVRDAAADLRYVPNATARSLRARRTRTLGLLLADLSDPIHGLVAAGFEAEAARSGYRVTFAAGQGDDVRERRSLRLFAEHAADGVAIASTLLDPTTARRLVPGGRVVIVQPDSPRLPRDRHTRVRGVIRTDDVAGMQAIASHLVACGYRDVAYAGDGARTSDVVRRRALERALADGPSPLPVRWVPAPDAAWRAPGPVVLEVMRSLPDVLVCFDDKLALAVLDGLRAHGVRVPEDIGVVGFDGIPFAEISNPRLTTVVTPAFEMGRRAAAILIAAVQTGTMPEAETLPVALAVRESTRVRGGPAGEVAPGA